MLVAAGSLCVAAAMAGRLSVAQAQGCPQARCLLCYWVAAGWNRYRIGAQAVAGKRLRRLRIRRQQQLAQLQPAPWRLPSRLYSGLRGAVPRWV